MLQKIKTSDGRLQLNIESLERALGPALAQQTLQHYALNRSCARMRRILPALTTFFSDHPNLLRLSPSELEHALSEHFYYIFYECSERSFSTRATEWDSIRLFASHLIKMGILPEFPILKTRSYTSFFDERDTDRQNNHLAPPRELFTKASTTSSADLCKEFPEFQHILKELPEYPTDQEFLELYETDQEQLVSKVRRAATEIIRKAHADFCYGTELVEAGHIEDIMQALRLTGHAIDTNVGTSQTQPIITQTIRTLAREARSVEGITRLNSEILTSYVVDQLTIVQIAEQRNTSTANIRIHLRRVRNKLNGDPTFSPLLSFLTKKTLATRKDCRTDISFFSARHPNGLANIVTATASFSSGIVCSARATHTRKYRPFPGTHHYSEHEGGAKRIAGYLGLTPRVATAIQTLIIIETGCNVDSLRRATVQFAKSTPLIRSSEAPGFDVLTLKKPRAGRHQEFVIPHGSIDKINASFCIRLALRLTKRLRDATNEPHLWLHSCSLDPRVKSYVLSDSTFKTQFKKLFDQHPILTEYGRRSPSAKKLRTTVGILRWLRTGGSFSAASSQLNNHARTAARNYIPPEIQTAYYKNQIAQFQSLLIKDTIFGQAKHFSPEQWAQDSSRLPLIEETSLTTQSCPVKRNATLIIWESKRLATILSVFERLIELQTVGELNENPDSLYWGLPYRDWKTLALFIRHHAQNTTSRHHKMVFRKANEHLPSCREAIRNSPMVAART